MHGGCAEPRSALTDLLLLAEHTGTSTMVSVVAGISVMWSPWSRLRALVVMDMAGVGLCTRDLRVGYRSKPRENCDLFARARDRSGESGACALLVHKNAGSDLMIFRVSEGPCQGPGRGEAGSANAAARSGLVGLFPSRLREWLPGVFAARLLSGVTLPGGRIVGETDRVVYLFPIPTGRGRSLMSCVPSVAG